MNDEHKVQNVFQSAGKYFFKPQNKRIFSKKTFSKKFSLFSGNENIFDDESIEFNDLDSNMLNRDLIKFLPTDSLRLELQLQRAEKRLKKIDNEINAIQTLQIEETEREELLENKKRFLNHKINSYKSQYRQLGYMYMAADFISETGIAIKEKIENLQKKVFSMSFCKLLLKKIPGYKEKQKLKALNMLQEKISIEINKKDKADPKKLEYLFFKKEQLS